VEVTRTNSVLVRSDKDGMVYTLNLDYLTDEARFIATHGTQPADSASGSEQIVGACGLKLGEWFDPNYATHTNKSTDTVTTKDETLHVNLTSYSFKPETPLPNFTDYSVGVTPRSNIVYSIEMRKSYGAIEAARPEEDKLLAVLQQKYGKATRAYYSATKCTMSTIKQGTREVSLISGFPTLGSFVSLRYTDTTLKEQAKWEQAQIDYPSLQMERKKLKQQL
jgi:hypothetical protein